MKENISLALQGVWSHKLRSALTMLGIIIGIAAIITIVSTIKGTNEQIKKNLIGSGNNVITVQMYKDGYAYDLGWNPVPDGVKPVSEETRQALCELDGVQTVSLYTRRSYAENVFYRNDAFTGTISGIDEYYLKTYGYQIRQGRGFTEADYRNFRKVLLVDTDAASNVFGGVNPVGQIMEIGSEVYTVVGVVAPAQEFTPTINSMNDYWLYANDSGGCIYMPISVWPVSYRFDEPQNVAIKVNNTDVMTTVGQRAAELLTGTQIASTDTGITFKSQDMMEQAQKLQEMSQSTNTQLIWIASISLLVGGIGVMNIMLVSVTERTGEIGLKKAIGAKKKRILMQFLTEAAVLTSLGGVVGVLIGVAMAFLISGMMKIPVAISLPAIAVAVVFSTLIGVVFGLLPATQAANLNPIDALRRE